MVGEQTFVVGEEASLANRGGGLQSRDLPRPLAHAENTLPASYRAAGDQHDAASVMHEAGHVGDEAGEEPAAKVKLIVGHGARADLDDDGLHANSNSCAPTRTVSPGAAPALRRASLSPARSMSCCRYATADINSVDLARYSTEITRVLKGYVQLGGSRMIRAVAGRISVLFAACGGMVSGRGGTHVVSPLLPSPLSVFAYLRSAAEDGTLWEATWVTVQRLLIGYGLGILAGLPLGLLTALLRWCQDTIGVLALGLQTLPSVCWVPLALLWFGQTEASLLFVVVMGTLWSLIIATDYGVRNISPIYMRAARTMGSPGLHTWIQVVLPAALPFLLSGMKQGWAFAWRSLMAAEIFVTILTGFGFGHLFTMAEN